MDFVIAYKHFVPNTFFKKREEHLVTFKSVINKLQINFLVVRKRDRKTYKEFEIILEENLTIG